MWFLWQRSCILKQEGVDVAKPIRDLSPKLVNLRLDDGIAYMNRGSFIQREQRPDIRAELSSNIFDDVQAIVADHDLSSCTKLLVALD